MRNDQLRSILAAVGLLGAIACGGTDGSAEPPIRLTRDAVELTAEQGGFSSQAVIVATTTVGARRIHLAATVEGAGVSVDTWSHEAYAVVVVRSDSELLAGEYRGIVILEACFDEACLDPVGGPPLRVPYTVTVLPPLWLPESVTLIANPGGTEGAEAVVSFTPPPGASGLDVSVVAGAGWLTVADHPDGFLVRAAPLPWGTYEGSLRVSVGPAVRIVRARYTVPPLPMVVTPPRLSLHAVSGETTSEPVNVSLPEDADDFVVEDRDPGWLEVERTTEGVLIHALAMPPGTYEASLTFRAGSSTVIVPVQYGVYPPFGGEVGIVALPSSLAFRLWPGAPDLSANVFTYAPAGSTVQPRLEPPEASEWLEVSEASSFFVVRADATGLDPGGHAAWLVFSGEGLRKLHLPVAVTYGEGIGRPPDRHMDVSALSTAADLGGSVLVNTVGPGQRWLARTEVDWLVLDQPVGWYGEALVYHVDPDHVAAMSPGSVEVATVSIEDESTASPPTQFQVRLQRW